MGMSKVCSAFTTYKAAQSNYVRASMQLAAREIKGDVTQVLEASRLLNDCERDLEAAERLLTQAYHEERKPFISLG